MLAQAYASLGEPAKARDCWAEAAELAEAVADPRTAEFRDRLADIGEPLDAGGAPAINVENRG